MKKRLLITSIVMMLVVAVALSTATYAWFTSNASVTASSITMTASTSNTASLAIAWVPTAGDPTFSSSIESDAVSGDFSPVAPTVVDDNTAYTSFTFAGSTIKTISGRNYFNSTPTATAPDTNTDAYVWTGLTGNSTTIRLKNMSTANATRNIWVTATIEDPDDNGSTPDGVALIRVAIFKNDGESGAFRLKGIMANAADSIAYGTIAVPSQTPTEYETAEVKMHISGNSAQATPVVPVSATVASTGLNLGALDTEATMDIKVVVWMDGQALGDDEGGLAAKVSLTFTEAAQ